MDKKIQELFVNQSQVIATLALRISVLEKLLLENKTLSEADLIKYTEIFSKEFAEKTQEAFRKAIGMNK